MVLSFGNSYGICSSRCLPTKDDSKFHKSQVLNSNITMTTVTSIQGREKGFGEKENILLREGKCKDCAKKNKYFMSQEE
jgi:hypothetical protein